MSSVSAVPSAKLCPAKGNDEASASGLFARLLCAQRRVGCGGWPRPARRIRPRSPPSELPSRTLVLPLSVQAVAGTSDESLRADARVWFRVAALQNSRRLLP